MTQRVQVQLVDDLSGAEAQETVRFSLDGTDFEIDLTQENADALRTVLDGYAGRARRSDSRRPSGGRVTQSIIDAYNESR